MDLNRLHEILRECTIQLRKGEAVIKEERAGMDVTHFYMMPHENEARPDLEKVDLCFLTVGVDKAKAEEHKTELVHLLRTYPDPSTLRSGPSYIAVGAEIGDQGAAFQLFALGKVLGLWEIITPETLGVTGAQVLEMAGAGYVMITGFRGEQFPGI